MSPRTSRWLLTGGLAAVALALVLWQGEPTDPAPQPAPQPAPPATTVATLGTPEGQGPTAEAETAETERTPLPREVELEPTQLVHWTVERMDETARGHMRLDERRRELVLRPFAPWLASMDREAAGVVLGHELTEAWYAELLAVEATWNADLAALGQLHADDLDRALRDTWERGRYQVEPRGPGGDLRHPEVGESRVAFPERAYYYRLHADDHPHLEDQRRETKRLQDQRSAAVRLRLRELIEGH